MTLPIKTRIEYYEDDIRRWENYLSRIDEDDLLVRDMVEQLKNAVKNLKEELENGND